MSQARAGKAVLPIGRVGLRQRYGVFLVAILLGATVVFVACSGSASKRAATGACRTHVLGGSLPVWARGGFHPPNQKIAHVMSAKGELAAILWANPLLSPPPRNHNNKILWVSRVATNPVSNLRISAQRMIGSTRAGSPVTRTVSGGPGPSIINVPAAGCWRFSLRWSGHSDNVDLRYAANR